MRCRRVRDLLPLFVGGDLPPRRTGAVERHLVVCARCRAEHDAYREPYEALAVYRDEGKPLVSFPDFWAGLRSRLEEDRSATLRPWEALAPIAPPTRAAWRDFPVFAAAGFLVALLGFFATRPLWLDGASSTSPMPGAGGTAFAELPARGTTIGLPERAVGSSMEEPAGEVTDDPRRADETHVHYHLPRVQLISTSGSVE